MNLRHAHCRQQFSSLGEGGGGQQVPADPGGAQRLWEAED